MTRRGTSGRLELTTPTRSREALTGSARALRYGAAGVLIVAGVACGALVPGTAGGTVATVLIGLGLVVAVSLVFYEVGLTEDRDRAQRSEGPGADSRPPNVPGTPRDAQDSPPAHGRGAPSDASHSGWPRRARRPRRRGE